MLDDCLIEVLEEGAERVFGHPFTDGIVGYSDGTFEVGDGVIGEQCAAGFVRNVDVAGCIDGAGFAPAADFENEHAWLLALCDADDGAVRSLESGQGGGDVSPDVVGVEIFNGLAARDAGFQYVGVEDCVVDLLAGDFEFVRAVKFHETFPCCD